MNVPSRPSLGISAVLTRPAFLPVLSGTIGLLLIGGGFTPGLPARGVFFFGGLCCVVGGGVGYLVLEEWRRRQVDLESFRWALVHELRKQDRSNFSFSQLVERAGVSRRPADEIAAELYQRVVGDCVRDGVVTASEAANLDQLAFLLELSPIVRSQIDARVKERRYAEHFRWVLADGALTDDEAAQLASLRASLGLTPDAVLGATGLTGGDAYRALFRQVIRKGHITEADLNELGKLRESSGLTAAAAQSLVREDALAFYRERFFAAKQDGHISVQEENELAWLQSFLGLSDNDTFWFREQIERIKCLERVRGGDLPTHSTHKLLEGGEICHWDAPCRYCWSTATYEKSAEGEVVITSQRVIFTSGVKRFEFKPARIVDIRCYSDGVSINTSGRHGAGLYFVADAELFAAILEAIARNHKYLAAERFSTTRSRQIPEQVKQEVWARDGGRCVRCGAQEYLEYDHVIPFSRGGANTVANVQILCRRCNLLKSDRI